jgi:hypothetical protein
MCDCDNSHQLLWFVNGIDHSKVTDSISQKTRQWPFQSFDIVPLSWIVFDPRKTLCKLASQWSICIFENALRFAGEFQPIHRVGPRANVSLCRHECLSNLVQTTREIPESRAIQPSHRVDFYFPYRRESSLQRAADLRKVYQLSFSLFAVIQRCSSPYLQKQLGR